MSKSKTPPAANPVRWVLVILLLLLQFGLIGWAIKKSQTPREPYSVSSYDPWDESVIETADIIPVQDGGRVKPLYSFARFRLLALYGRAKMEVEVGDEVVKIGPTEWLMDVMFRPEVAHTLPTFRVDNTKILEAIGLDTGKRRAYFSLNDLLPAYNKLIERGRDAEEKVEKSGAKSLTLEEKQLNELATRVLQYQGLATSLDFAREDMPIDPATFPENLDVETFKRFSNWLASFPMVLEKAQREYQERGALSEQTGKLWRTMETFIVRSSFGMNWLPSYEESEKVWTPLGKRLRKLTNGEATYWQEAIADLKEMEDLVRAQKEGNFGAALTDWRRGVVSRAREEGLDEQLRDEVDYYQSNYFMRALVFFIIAFVIGVLTWFAPNSKFAKYVGYATAVFFILGALTLGWGILQRSLLLGRPPVGNLYDTLPFITFGAVVLLGLAELLTRRKVLMSLGALLGIAGLFLTFRFEFGDAKDHMDPLNAVLNSNYWLATHVVTITLGYSGGLVACFLSQIYLHVRLAGVIEQDRSFQRFMTRAVYGVICFTLVFSLIGTVLGGIWANDSWGRFWGWDPKENGALMIVLWSLIILHARLAGWATNWGLHYLSVLMGIVVAFSWWHVNLLGVGLHSYGFTEGRDGYLYIFYCMEVLALVVGGLAWLFSKGRATGREAAVEKDPSEPQGQKIPT